MAFIRCKMYERAKDIWLSTDQIVSIERSNGRSWVRMTTGSPVMINEQPEELIKQVRQGILDAPGRV